MTAPNFLGWLLIILGAVSIPAGVVFAMAIIIGGEPIREEDER